MEDVIWQGVGLTLVLGGVVAVIILLYWLDYSGWAFRIQKWFWSSLFLVGGLIALGYMISTVSFDKPIVLSIYWSTIGYLVLAILLLMIGLMLLFIKE